MKQAHDYRKYNVRLTSADWQRGSARVIKQNILLIDVYIKGHKGILLSYIRNSATMPSVTGAL